MSMIATVASGASLQMAPTQRAMTFDRQWLSKNGFGAALGAFPLRIAQDVSTSSAVSADVLDVAHRTGHSLVHVPGISLQRCHGALGNLMRDGKMGVQNLLCPDFVKNYHGARFFSACREGVDDLLFSHGPVSTPVTLRSPEIFDRIHSLIEHVKTFFGSFIPVSFRGALVEFETKEEKLRATHARSLEDVKVDLSQLAIFECFQPLPIDLVWLRAVYEKARHEFTHGCDRIMRCLRALKAAPIMVRKPGSSGLLCVDMRGSDGMVVRPLEPDEPCLVWFCGRVSSLVGV